jgi:hypothetical protein
VDLLPNLLLGVEIATATFGGLAMTGIRGFCYCVEFRLAGTTKRSTYKSESHSTVEMGPQVWAETLAI